MSCSSRLLASLILVVLLFVATLVMVPINTDNCQKEFLIITLVIVVLINIASAIFQGGFRGLAGCFPPAYMNAVLNGMVRNINIIDFY